MEFEKYNVWVESVRQKIDQAHKTLDMAETRTRAVNRKLRSVETHLQIDSKKTGDISLPLK